MARLTLTPAQYAALPKVVRDYWPDTEGGKVELETGEVYGVLTVRVFNPGLSPREVTVTPEGRIR